jgi:hypothetical protein
MRGIGALALCTALVTVSGAAAGAQCPPHEAGAEYPWDVHGMLPGDKYAWVFIDVDRSGRPSACKVGETNIFDSDTLFQLCSSYKESWRAPAASAGDPDSRTIKRQTVMIGSAHQLANQQARRAWFKLHPDERPSCYPED